MAAPRPEAQAREIVEVWYADARAHKKELIDAIAAALSRAGQGAACPACPDTSETCTCWCHERPRERREAPYQRRLINWIETGDPNRGVTGERREASEEGFWGRAAARLIVKLDAARREGADHLKDATDLAAANAGLAQKLDAARREADALREALQDAPDMTCESPEAREWRKKYAAILAAPPPAEGEERYENWTPEEGK